MIRVLIGTIIIGIIAFIMDRNAYRKDKQMEENDLYSPKDRELSG